MKRWRMVVSDLGGSEVRAEVEVEADNWMSALRKGRAELGEQGGVPTGSSCAVSADGLVTVLDPVDRRRFSLAPAEPAAPPTSPSRPPSQPPPRGLRIPADEVPRAAPTPTASSETPSYRPPSTQAETPSYRPPSPDSYRPPSPDVTKPSSPPPAMASSPPAKKMAKQTMAYIPAGALPAVTAVPVGAPASQAPGAPESPVFTPVGPDAGASSPAASSAPAGPAPSSPPAGPAPSSAPASTAPSAPPTSAGSAASAPAPKKKRAMTMAYIAGKDGPPLTELVVGTPSASVPAPEASAPTSVASNAGTGTSLPETTGPRVPTVPPEAAAPAATPVSSPPEAAAPPEAAVGGSTEPPAATTTAEATEGVDAGVAWRLLLTRDVDPTAENPLCYRERTYLVAEGSSADVAERIAVARVESLRALLEGGGPGKFVNVAIFDHAWDDRPLRPPVVTAQWKDWQGDLVCDRPLARWAAPTTASTPPPASAATSTPPTSTARASTPAPAPRPRRTTDDHDARLADAFEACQDLFFLGSATEGLDFALKLFAQLLPAEAAVAALYDIDDDVLRIVLASGDGGAGRQGDAIPNNTGLFGVAAAMSGGALRVAPLSSDPRFVPEVDGWVGLDARNALFLPLVHQGRLLGVLQLVNRRGDDAFSQEDADLGVYVAGQVGQFLHQAKLRPRR